MDFFGLRYMSSTSSRGQTSNATLAYHHQAMACLQRGDIEGGIAALRKLLKLAPDHAEAHFKLGVAYLESGKIAASLPYFRRVIALAPEAAEGYFYLGLALAHLRRGAEALPAFEKAAALQPSLPEAHLNLGSAFNDVGRYEEAAAAFKRTLALRPEFAEAHNGLGNALRNLGDMEEAEGCYRRAIALRANYAEPCQGLGMLLNDKRRFDEAADQFRQAIILKPDFVMAFTGWGHALHEMGQHQAARACWEKAIELEPKEADAHAGLAGELRALNAHTRALASYQKAARLDDRHIGVCRELGGELFVWGRMDEGLAYLKKAVKLSPKNFFCNSSLIFNLHYHPAVSATEIAARHRAFGESFEAPLKPLWRAHANIPDSERRLRVGFVSGDLRRHSVGFFMADLIPSMKDTGLELYAYANQWLSDDLTERIKPMFVAWRECKTLSDEAMAEQIRADGIDVLVDLSGHTSGCRLMALALRPAPVQVTWLGYPDTTGLTAFDYILGDRTMFPPEEEHLYVEEPWRLPDTSLCFMPPDLPVEVAPLPALQQGFVTFGCLNKREKINDTCIDPWAKILHAVPGSRLLLQNRVYSDVGIVKDMQSRFSERGIEAHRLEVIGNLPWREHIETYSRVDIALDPFPYNGTTTTVEGLWMGVPVVALKGDRLAAHMGESIMRTMQMPEWIAADRDEYVAKAVGFANDLPALTSVRAGLRNRLLASPICDAPRFARSLEAGLRGMWREWCAKQNARDKKNES